MPLRLRLKPYIDQRERWPERGQVILAHYDDATVVVYQAFNKQIARYAAEHQTLGAGFSHERMSWIKPNFLWMMHRSEWATAVDQKYILAIWLQRSAFDRILSEAVPSRFDSATYPDKAAWQAALDASEVRVQWDPSYTPKGIKQPLKAIQIGLRGETLRQYASEWIVQIEDITPVVRQQAQVLPDVDLLLIPAERIYPVTDQTVVRRLGLDKSTVP